MGSHLGISLKFISISNFWASLFSIRKIMFHRDNNLEIYFQVAISHSTFANQNDLEPFFINNNKNSSHGL